MLSLRREPGPLATTARVSRSQLMVHANVRPLDLEPILFHGARGHVRRNLLLPGERGERRHGDALRVNLEESSQGCSGVRAPEPICTEDYQLTTHILLNELRVGSHIIRSDDGHALPVSQAVRYVAAGYRLVGAKPRYPLCSHSLAMELSIVSGAPNLCGNPKLFKLLCSLKDLLHDRTRADQPDCVSHPLLGRPELVQTLEEVLFKLRILWDLWHRMVLVVQRDVIDQVLVFAPHLLNAMLYDVRHLVGEGRVPANHRGVGDADEQGVAVLVLQPLAVQRGAPGRGAQQEAPGASIRRLPNDVAHTLEAEHRVVDEEGHHGTLLGGIGSARSDPGAKRSSFADAFLQDLPIGRLRIFHETVVIDGRVMLPEGRVDLELVEERVHSEGASLIRDHGYTPLPELASLHQAPQERSKGHGGTHRLGVALVKHGVDLGGREVDESADLGRQARWQGAAQLLPLLQHVLDLRGVWARLAEELATLRILDLLVGQRNLQDVAKAQHLLHLQAFLLMDCVPALEGRQREALERLRQDHGGPATRLRVLSRLRHGGVDLLVVVASWKHEGAEQLVV
mmetsp:Transcript_23242/g.55205  ORF Transcript_23242/g.55205 Transcript_23242/m.55205 type:complete len:569 (-) Transcript_23242:1578-3284(-)